MDASLLGQIFRVLEKLMTQAVHCYLKNGNMMTNMTGSSILKSTGCIDQVKPGNLSVRFILEEGEPCSDNLSDSEQSEGISDSEDDWESCVSSVEEDECF